LDCSAVMNTNTALATIIACSDSLDHVLHHLAATVGQARGAVLASIRGILLNWIRRVGNTLRGPPSQPDRGDKRSTAGVT
jgi:hypothetical protein